MRGLFLALSVGLFGCSQSSPQGLQQVRQGKPTSETCQACHAAEYEAWRGSHHDDAMQHATPEAVLGDFAAAPLRWSRGDEVHQTSFRREGDSFFMRTEGDLENNLGANADFRIAFTFGITPLQQYLVEAENGILQCLPIAWDTEAKQWFHLAPEPPVGDALHWTGRMQRWNMMCAECHSTELVKGLNAEMDSYETTYSELDVGCRSCHGSSEEHVRLAATWGGSQAPRAPGERGFGDAQDPARMELETCAPCHSRRSSLTEDWKPGQQFLDHYDPALLREGLYFPDGQILDEVYVWGSFTQSRMHEAGVTCSDCHDPHSLKLKLPEGLGHNELCVQCHSVAPQKERFPTLLGKNYDTPEHHHHQAGSEAARCTTCHMPTRTYMGVDERRDHRMGVPRPDLTLDLSVPNACANCHDGKEDAAWATAAIDLWRGGEQATSVANHRQLDAQLARTFAGAQALGRATDAERGVLFAKLQGFVKTLDLPALQRATALELLADFGPSALGDITAGLQDKAPLVRATAARALRRFPQSSGITLKLREARLDPVTLVRVAAAAPEDYERYHELNADFPSSHFDRGMWDQAQGNFKACEARWRKALSLDPDFLPAVYNLSVLLSAQGGGAQAAELLASALDRHPQEGELAYSLGLQLAELGKQAESLVRLQLAAQLLPDRPRVAYNLSLAYSAVGDTISAELELRRAIRLQTGSKSDAADSIYALAILLMRSGRLEEARTFCLELQTMEIPAAKQLLDELDRLESLTPPSKK